MRCPACGMESKTSDRCEWCRNPIVYAAVLPPDAQAGITPGTVRKSRTTLTGEVEYYDEVISTPKYSAPVIQTHGVVPDTTVQINLNQPQATMQMNTQQLQPTIQMNMQTARAMTAGRELSSGLKEGETLPQKRLLGDISILERWEKYLALAFPVMVLSLIWVHFAPNAYILVTCIDLFILGMFMGIFRAVPSFDDEYTDVSVVLIVCVMFGPLLALMGYGILCLIRQDGNPAIFALFVLYYFVSITIGIAFQSSVNSLGLIVSFGMFNLLGFLVVFLCFAGWLCSSFFIPLDE